ncbi:MAG: hypothetical protein HPY64_15635 [Anaerolineae bacterium]|nr:hypothetical protein [Anaerolineae bacterium]
MLPERRYRTAIVALRHGNWEDAAHHLLTIAAEYPSYRDVEQVLTRLERTRPAAYWRAVVEVALARNAWDRAARALERLSDLNPAPADLEVLRSRLEAQMTALTTPAVTPQPAPPVSTEAPPALAATPATTLTILAPPSSSTATPAPAAMSSTAVITPAEQAAPVGQGDSRSVSPAFRNPLYDFVADPLPIPDEDARPAAAPATSPPVSSSDQNSQPDKGAIAASGDATLPAGAQPPSTADNPAPPAES